MTQFLFYKGHDATPQGAVCNALCQCGEVLLNNPSLIVQLENLYETGRAWDADIRIMALDTTEDAISVKQRRRGKPLTYEMKDPEHARSGNPTQSLAHDTQPMTSRFGNAVVAGEVPDIPIQEIVVPGYDPTLHTEAEMRRLILEHEQKRLHKIEQLEHDLD